MWLFPAYKLYNLHVILIKQRKTTPVADAGEITTMSNAIPQDSILRRHFEQISSGQGLSSVPQDSILARHHAQMMAAGSVAQNPAAAQAPVAPKTPTAAPAAATTAARSRPAPPPPAQPQKGFFGRMLDALFGRS
jgi:hypothetical protein